MSQEKWKGWVEIVGVISIVVTLIFVAFEIRQNTYAVRSGVIQDVTAESMGVIRTMLEDDSLREAMRATDAGTASEAQQDRMSLFYAMMLRLQQNRFLQIELGLVDKEQMMMLGGRAYVYRRAGFRAHWAQARDNYTPEFRTFVETELMSPPPMDSVIPQ